MTTPQNPGDGDTPQDPSDPQNPYGTPAGPPAEPTAPVTPIPATPPPYGDPSAPQSAPPPMSPMPPAAPAYGQPPYGQPAYGQPAYGQPAYPQQGAAPAQPGKGMAITALILSCICCLDVVGIILAIVVLVRSRDGQNRGRGLALWALVIGVITLVVTVVLVGLGVKYVNDLSSVNDLKPGDCITAHGLTDDSSDSIDTIRTVGCSEKHDGEVLATTEVTADLAKDFSKMDPQATCAPAIEAAGKTALVTEDINVTALTVSDPSEGDNIACVAYSADGKKLTSKLGS
jgi:heme/copper-type cytochrome/quinol oxidase subunit 2